eukprot:CAMPEP_0203919096 /NCGR_PEP_ID=MMETSP0359-20131031/59567_1 /ASSEMBLY_ACC=CAM_ASM_000338 /TAXON_ID=268821 /ORGANISM="Scrippsiella Hangoei, Strain SHTV-5" /LENGTH=52 /DNA_ID=CAMNT_0050846311 /DNA_START=13 /DNA_END=167 /DNA_ORIENTATION=+
MTRASWHAFWHSSTSCQRAWALLPSSEDVVTGPWATHRSSPNSNSFLNEALR